MTKNQRIIYLIAGIFFVIGAIFALLDLTDTYKIPGLDDPFTGLMVLLVIGMSLMLFARQRGQKKS